MNDTNFVRWILFTVGKEEFYGTMCTTMYDLLWNVISNKHEQWKFLIRSLSILECQYFRIKSCLKKENVFNFCWKPNNRGGTKKKQATNEK